MSRVARFLSCSAVLSIALGLSGCGGEKQSTKLSPEEAKIKASLAKLSDADRAAAEKQRICPVSDERLGVMETPHKITVKGSDGTEHEVFICCEACKETIEGDPDTYLAKLK